MQQLKVFYMVLIGTLLFCIISASVPIAQELPANFSAAKSDSLLKSYSIEELLEYREHYRKQIDEIERNKRRLRKQGIRDAENYLKTNSDSKIIDKIVMRLAELYYQEENDEYIEAMQKYDKRLEELEKQNIDDADLTEPEKSYDKSLELYQKIIDDFPNSELYDDAIYNKAFLLEELGQAEKAVDVYRRLIDEFPSGRYTPEALMRIGEYYFNPPVNDIDNAISYYKKILEYRESPKYDEALYRLGWSYYRLNKYPEAVAYFTLLADDVQRAKKLDPGHQYTNPVLRDESIEYIGISFLDYGGASGAVDYIKNIGGREYGVEILNKIGDVYKDEKEEYAEAIETYQLLLRMYPLDQSAPEIQEKIVDCYRLMRDDMKAYLARNELYDRYRPGSSWWQKHENEAVREKTAAITERALRDNINLLFKRAEELNDRDLYLQAVDDSRKYLKSFPTDSSAKLIHWNMALTLDTKLKDYEQAYTEYMKISDIYWNTKYQKYAAENAIALAKDMVASDSTRKEMIAAADADSLKSPETRVLSTISYESKPLTSNERKLARAYNNYIKIYPHEPATAVILSNTGALYYNNNQFQEALKYFNTILKHFENSSEADYAQYMAMESYFGKHDFASAEIVARRLKNKPDLDPELLERVKERLAASIYLAAEVFADSANHLAAGDEYIRVVKEVPDAEFADLSLFNAALEYDKANEYRRAIETYNYLIETRPNSKYLLDAMNNLAIDYGELGENKNAAITYERLHFTARDSINKYDALYNASIFFVKAEEWEDAIRINRKFVEKYPDSEDADDMFFDVATYYLKLNDLENANKLYGEYVHKFPNSPRVVETYYHRGEYFRKNNQIDRAIAEYRKSVDKNEEFKNNNKPGNDFFAAEALFNMTMIKYNEYCKIEFRLPQYAMEQSKERKKNLLKEVIDGFSKVVGYGSLRLYEATYRIGDAYEDFAETWARQEMPTLEETQKIVLLKENNHTAAELYARAEKSYKQAVNVLQKLADKYEEELAKSDTTRYADENSRLKVAAEDSTLRVAQKWIDVCKEKISEVIYDIAELNLVTVNSFLEAAIPEGLDDIAEMEYRRQVLGKAVAPLIKQISEAHTRNIEEASDLGLENQWVKLSRRKIITTNNILANEYHALASKSLNLYENNSAAFRNIIEDGEISSNEIDPIAISEQMVNLIDFGNIFAAVAFDMNVRTIQKANDLNISDPVVADTEERMMRSLFQYTEHIDSLFVAAKSYVNSYEKLYEESAKPGYEEAIFAFEDNQFAFSDSRNELLQIGYETAENFDIQNRWSANILIALVRTNPVEYSGLLDVDIKDKVLTSDASWRATNEFRPEWTKNNYNDRDWATAEVVQEEVSGGISSPGKIWYMVTDTTNSGNDNANTKTYVADEEEKLTSFADADTTTANTAGAINDKESVGSNLLKIPSEKVFFRKEFFIDGLPVSADIKLTVDDSYNIYLNGEYIASSVRDSSVIEAESSHSLSDFLRTKSNILALECTDSDRSGGGMEAILSIRSIPEWDNVRQKYEIESSDETIRKNLILDKYIIIN
ncbi:tetratricopeptide repeat protein [candidate division KSB1 bacterium]|nr:tetratricopeptide repeat protein [candidate division KSB1 bacterium]